IVSKTSLRKWAKENKVWEPKAWRIFLEKDIVPFYKQAYTLNVFYRFLKSEKICGKTSLADIEDETLKNKIRVAIYGGVEPNKDFNKSFAKFMYDNFGICAENAPSFEESIKHYESWGDSIKVSVNSSWISSIQIEKLVDDLGSLIKEFSDKLDIELSEIGIQESYPYLPVESANPETLLPQAGEKPEKLVSLLNDFRQKALDLSIGINPFTTFVFYSRTIPLLTLMEFLECDMNEVIELANFLGLKGYSMVDASEIDLSTKSPDKVILSQISNSLSYGILKLQSYLENIDPVVKQVYENMIKQAIDQVHVAFEPWKDYEPIFSFISEILKERDWIGLDVKNGRIVKVTSNIKVYTYKRYYSYKEAEIPSKILLRDFLLKLSPVVSGGIVDIISFSDSWVSLKFHPFAKKLVDKVIKNEGKT
ncbi:hypothetical protein, partial [Persephonella sp.]|uniref:hypothetical protein n=1 Tax=Persephonella sp. TaxID=2060922 RepID=UPI0025F0063B